MVSFVTVVIYLSCYVHMMHVTMFVWVVDAGCLRFVEYSRPCNALVNIAMIIVTYAVVLSFESLWGIRLLPLLSIDRAHRHTHTWFSNTGNFHYRWIRCTVSVGKIVYGVCVCDQYCLILIPVDIVEGWICCRYISVTQSICGVLFSFLLGLVSRDLVQCRA